MTKRFWQVLTGLALALAFALPVHAAEYETVLSELDQLQGLAEAYIAANNSDSDVFSLTLSYTRVGEYNASIWQLVAGTHDPEFDNYVAGSAPELAELQGMRAVTLPNGQNIDFGHLLAAMDLVHKGAPIAGTWGGDCMQLAQAYAGQASDTDGYMALEQATFNIEDDGSASVFGAQDLRADMDAIVLGSRLTEGGRLADIIRSYYTSLTDRDRVSNFISLSFGAVDTGNQDAFRQKVYDTLAADTGMQLLLYFYQMWDVDSWTVKAESEPALRAACSLLADYMASAVEYGRVDGSSGTLMQTVSKEALAAALSSLGDETAAQAALGHDVSAGDATPQPEGSRVDGVLDDATEHLRSRFNVNLFRAILLVIGAAALIACIVFTVLFILEARKPPKRRRRRA